MNLFSRLCLLPVWGSLTALAAPTNLTITVYGDRISLPSEPAAGLWRTQSARFAVREQSVAGGLTDLSINGSAFSEAGIVLNGAAVRNVQTEHFNADLPLPAAWMSTPRVLTGIDLVRLSVGHPAGSLAVSLDRPYGPSRSVTLGGGTDGLMFGRAQALETFSLSDSVQGWAGAFFDTATADQIDGYSDNHLKRLSAGARLGAAGENWQSDLLISGFIRTFGVRGAYGTNEKYPAEEENTGGQLSGTWQYDAGDDQPAELTLLWLRSHDVYRLDRHDHDFYENAHTADTITLHGTTRRHITEAFFADLRSDTLFEIIRSTALGDHSRVRQSLSVLPGVRFGDVELAAGPVLDLFSDDDARFSPAAGISWFFTEEQRLELAYREGIRQPSYTELNYESPDSLGKKGLPLQRTQTVSLDWHYTPENGEGRLGVFFARGEHLVDWLRFAPGSAWQATALRSVHSFGLSGDGRWKVNQSVTLGVDGVVTLKQTDTDYYASRYAMDGPLAGGSVFCSWALTDEVTIEYRQGAEVWKSNPVRRGSNVRNISRAEFRYEPSWLRSVSAAIGVCDLFDQAFEVFPGQKAAGLTAFASVTYAW